MRLLLWVLVGTFVAISAARATDIAQYAQTCGHPIEGRNITGITRLDASRCADDCFRATLTCNNGRKFTVATRYNPGDPAWLGKLTDMYPLPQLLVYGAIAFLVFIAWMGTPLSRSGNLTYLGLVGLGMYFWPATTSSVGAPFAFTAMALGFSVFGFPIFLALNLAALMRGWDYAFVKHPAEPIIEPALRARKPVDTNALADELEAGARDPGAHAAYHWENQAEKARALTHKLDAARAEMAAAERALDDARRRSEQRP